MYPVISINNNEANFCTGVAGSPGGDVPVFETAQQLRDFLYPTSHAVAMTLGALSVGDGGGGTWRWDATSTEIDNLVTVLLPTGYLGDGRWLRSIPTQILVSSPDGTLYKLAPSDEGGTATWEVV